MEHSLFSPKTPKTFFMHHKLYNVESTFSCKCTCHITLKSSNVVELNLYIRFPWCKERKTKQKSIWGVSLLWTEIS